MLELTKQLRSTLVRIEETALIKSPSRLQGTQGRASDEFLLYGLLPGTKREAKSALSLCRSTNPRPTRARPKMFFLAGAQEVRH